MGILASQLLFALRPTFRFGIFTTRHLAVIILLSSTKKPIEFSMIAKTLRISKPSTSRIISSLLRLNFVHSWRFKNDKRRVLILLSEQGDDFMKEVLASQAELEKLALSTQVA